MMRLSSLGGDTRRSVVFVACVLTVALLLVCQGVSAVNSKLRLIEMKKDGEQTTIPPPPRASLVCGFQYPFNLSCFDPNDGSITVTKIYAYFGEDVTFAYTNGVGCSKSSTISYIPNISYMPFNMTNDEGETSLIIAGISDYYELYQYFPLDGIIKNTSNILGMADPYEYPYLYFLNGELNQITELNGNEVNGSKSAYDIPSTFTASWASFDAEHQVVYISGQEDSKYIIRSVNFTSGAFLNDVTLNVTNATAQFPWSLVWAPSLNKLLSVGFVVADAQTMEYVAEVTQIDPTTGDIIFMDLLRDYKVPSVSYNTIAWDDYGRILYINQFPTYGVNVTRNTLTTINPSHQFPLSYQPLSPARY